MPTDPVQQQRPAAEVLREIASAMERIRYGSVLIQIQDGVAVQIEATEKKRFPGPPKSSSK